MSVEGPATTDGLESALQDFIVQAQIAQDSLRDFMVANGMKPPDRTLAHCWHGVVEQLGVLPGGGRYFFHGEGCEVYLPGHPPIDIDWTDDGATIVDAHKMQPWLQDRCRAPVTIDDITTSMTALTTNGELLPAGWPTHAIVARHSEPQRPSG